MNPQTAQYCVTNIYLTTCILMNILASVSGLNNKGPMPINGALESYRYSDTTQVNLPLTYVHQ